MDTRHEQLSSLRNQRDRSLKRVAHYPVHLLGTRAADNRKTLDKARRCASAFSAPKTDVKTTSRKFDTMCHQEATPKEAQIRSSLEDSVSFQTGDIQSSAKAKTPVWGGPDMNDGVQLCHYFDVKWCIPTMPLIMLDLSMLLQLALKVSSLF